MWGGLPSVPPGHCRVSAPAGQPHRRAPARNAAPNHVRSATSPQLPSDGRHAHKTARRAPSWANRSRRRHASTANDSSIHADCSARFCSPISKNGRPAPSNPEPVKKPSTTAPPDVQHPAFRRRAEMRDLRTPQRVTLSANHRPQAVPSRSVHGFSAHHVVRDPRSTPLVNRCGCSDAIMSVPASRSLRQGSSPTPDDTCSMTSRASSSAGSNRPSGIDSSCGMLTSQPPCTSGPGWATGPRPTR